MSAGAHVGVWWCPTTAVTTLQARRRAAAWCEPHELAAGDALLRPADAHAHRVAHTLLRRALRLWTGVPEPAHRLTRDAHGRPIVDDDTVRVSLSHTRTWVAVAVASGVDGALDGIGVDVEGPPAARRTLLDEVCGAYSVCERAAIATLTPTARPSAVLRLWTLKEAYLKATGSGLSVPVDAVGFALPAAEADLAPGALMLTHTPGGHDPGRWWFSERALPDGTRLALAVHGARPRVVLHGAGFPAVRRRPAPRVAAEVSS